MEEYRARMEAMEQEGRGRMRSRLDQFGNLIRVIGGKFNELMMLVNSFWTP